MLVLTRRAGETLVLELPDGQHITVTIAGVDARRAKVGIDAPPSVRVRRGELEAGGDGA